MELHLKASIGVAPQEIPVVMPWIAVIYNISY
jgi:hypothetical protein